MNIRNFLVATIFVALAQSAIAQTQPLRLFVSNGMKAVVEELRPRIEKEAGQPLAIQFNTSTAIRQQIEAGNTFDVAIITTEVINDLAKAGKIASGSVVGLGRSGIGFGVRSGAAKPDIRTPDAVKQTLLNTKSMTWVSAGASRVHIERMLQGLGIADAVKSKIVLTQSVDESLAAVADGKTEMIITLTSEIRPAKGVQYLGPLPDKFQNYVAFSGGVGPTSSAAAASALLLKQLSAPSAASVYQTKGMELPIKGVK